LWYPTAERPEWLDGSLPGDRGFDPLGLSKPTEYIQMDLDALDQNAPKNRAGGVLGTRIDPVDEVSTDSLQPYSEVFGLQRFRECEVIHGRWCMLATLGILVGEYISGVSWNTAGLYELDGAKYFGNELPFTTTQIVIFEVLAMGGAEIYRNTELDTEKRCYPGGPFDPFGLASKDEATTFRLKEAEIKHGRLAMIAFLGFASQALQTGLGATESFNAWAGNTFGVAMFAATSKKAGVSAVQEQDLWYPTAERPEWLDGSLPGDRGFDPLGLSKPTEYIQMDLDALDQNAPKNRAGGVLGTRIDPVDEVSTDSLQPYSEVFGLQRFRECEVIHGRWCMLATLGILVGEYISGVSWNTAGLYELDGAKYFGNELPFTTTQIVIFEVLAMGGAEIYRNTELDTEKRCYPGGPFDPFGLASKDEATTFRLKEAEIKHGRLAMIAFLGFASQALQTGLGATESFNAWAGNTFGF